MATDLRAARQRKAAPAEQGEGSRRPRDLCVRSRSRCTVTAHCLVLVPSMDARPLGRLTEDNINETCQPSSMPRREHTLLLRSHAVSLDVGELCKGKEVLHGSRVLDAMSGR